MDNMITIPEGCICIPLDMYDEMSSDVDSLYLLRTALFENCLLSWDKERLSFDDKALSMALSMIEPREYRQTLHALISEEQEGTNAGTD